METLGLTSDASSGSGSFVLVILKHFPSLSLQPLVLLQTNPNHQQKHSHQNTHDRRTHAHVLLPSVLFLIHLQCHPPRLLTSLNLQLRSFVFLLDSCLQVTAVTVQKYSKLFVDRLITAYFQLGRHFPQKVLVQLSSLDGVQPIQSLVLRMPHKGKSLQSWQHYLSFCFQSVDFIVVVVVPESVDTFVGVGQEIARTHVQVVQIVALENRLSLPVTVLFAFAVPLPERLDNRGMSLILAKENHVLSLDTVKRLAHAMTHCYLPSKLPFKHRALLLSSNLAGIIQFSFTAGLAFFCYFDETDFGIQSQYYPFGGVEGQTDIHQILHSALQAHIFPCYGPHFLDLLVAVVESIQSQSPAELGSQKHIVSAGQDIEMNNRGGAGEGVVLVVEAVEQKSSGFIVDQQQGFFLVDFVDFEFIESLQVLQIVTGLHSEALVGLLHHDDAVRSKKDQQTSVQHQQVPVLVRHCRPQLLQHRNVRTLLLQRVTFEGLHFYSAGLEMQVGLVGLELGLDFEALAKGNGEFLELADEERDGIAVLCGYFSNWMG